MDNPTTRNRRHFRTLPHRSEPFRTIRAMLPHRSERFGTKTWMLPHPSEAFRI